MPWHWSGFYGEPLAANGRGGLAIAEAQVGSDIFVTVFTPGQGRQGSGFTLYSLSGQPQDMLSLYPHPHQDPERDGAGYSTLWAGHLGEVCFDPGWIFLWEAFPAPIVPWLTHPGAS